MAQLLQREHSLPVITIGIEVTDRHPVVRCQLIRNVDDEQILDDEGGWPLAAFGEIDLEQRGPQISPLAVPDGMADWIAGWAGAVLQPDEPMWLLLRKPYGLLGAVPWERDLGHFADRPVLRLPDALPGPRMQPLRRRVAICATGPWQEGASPAAQVAPELAQAIIDGTDRIDELAVFVDPYSYGEMQPLQGLPVRVTVYEPDDLVEARPDGFEALWEREGGGENQWLWWMRQVLTRTGVDIVHFVLHGVRHGEEGAVLTPRSPTDPTRDVPQHVTVGELREFSNAVGASILGFTGPPDNWNDYGLRRVADELGSRRAGPVLHHDLGLADPGQLAWAFEFLTSADPSSPPHSAGLSLYAQPRMVRTEYRVAPQPWQRDLVATFDAADDVKRRFRDTDAPAWLAAAERYLEDQRVELARFEQSKQSRDPTPAQVEHFEGVRAALGQARAIIDEHARRAL